jgi:hypothetical protein
VRTHIRQFSLPAQVRHQGSRVVVEILPAHSVRGMGVRVVAPAENARLWEDFGEEVSEPVDAVFRRPCFLSVAVEPMQCDDAAVVSQEGAGARAWMAHTRLSDRAPPRRQPRGLAGAPPSDSACGAPEIVPASFDPPSERIPMKPCRLPVVAVSLSEGVWLASRSLQIVNILRRPLGCSFGAVILGTAELDPVSPSGRIFVLS